MLDSVDELAVPHLARVVRGLLERDPDARLTAAGVIAGLRPARAAETDAPPLATKARLRELFRCVDGVATSLRDAVRGVGDLHPAVVSAAVREGEERAGNAGPSAAQLGAINLYSREHTRGPARSLYHRLNAALRADCAAEFEPLKPYARLLYSALAALPAARPADRRTTAYRWIQGAVSAAQYPVGGEVRWARFSFGWFLGAGGRLPQARRGRVLCAILLLLLQVLWAGFSSCSAPEGSGALSFNQFGQADAGGGARTLFIISLPEGAGASYVTGYSRFAGEDEVLLPPGSRLRVTGATPAGNGLETFQLVLLGVLSALV